MISDSLLRLMMEMVTFSFVIPLAMIAVWKMRTKCPLKPVFIGMLIYFLFSVLFISIPNTILFGFVPGFGKFVTAHQWAQLLYTAIVSAIFTGLAYYFIYKFFLQNNKTIDVSMSIGLGYAALNSIYMLGWSTIQNYAFATYLNSVGLEKVLKTASNKAGQEQIKANIDNINLKNIVFSGVEHFYTFFLLVAVSIIAFYGIRKVNQMKYFALSIAIVFGVKCLSVVSALNIVPHIVVLACNIIITVGVCKFAHSLYKEFDKTNKKESSTKSSSWEFAKKKLSGSNHED